jgi:hypothetical protein
MANRVPLIVDTSTLQIKELPAGDSLDLTNSGIVNAGVITATSFSGNIGGTPTLGTGVTVTTSGLHVTGVVTATSGFSGDLTGNVTGTPTLGTGVTVTTSGMNVSGVLTATSFSGDGSGLTNTGATLSAASGSQRLVVSSLTSGVMTTAATDGDLAWNASTNTLSATNVTIGGTLTYQDVTNIDSLGIITARNGLRVTAGGINVTAGVSTFSGSTVFKAHGTFEDNKQLRIGTGPDIVFYHDQSNTRLTQNSTAAGDLIFDTSDGATTIAKFLKGTKAVELYFGGASKIETRTDGAAVVGILTASGLNVVTGVSTFAGAIDANSTLDVASTSVFNNDLTLTGASKNIVWDKSDQQLEINGDNSNVAKVAFGDSHDLQIYKGASSGNAFIHNAAGTLNITQNSGTIKIDKNTGDEMAHFNVGGSVQLFHNSLERVTTSADGTDFGGTGAIGITKGTTGQRPGSPAAGDFRYNTSDGAFEGYTDEWGAIGGGSAEVDNIISQTTATGVGTFAATDIRSAYIRAQIQQGASYQVGRYLMIHDNSSVTVIEESAVATGNMLGSFDGVISGGNAVLRVTMVSAASTAVVTTLIDTITT